MLVIRLFRVGKKNQPSFKIVVTDKRNPPKSGRFVEEVGFWNPLIKQKVLNKDRIKYWLSVGAQPSETIHNLLISEKIIEGKKIAKDTKTDAEAVGLGIKFEKDSITFYEGMKKVVPEYDQKIIDRLIGQEKEHLRQLTELKKTL